MDYKLLLQDFGTPYESIPFSKIKTEYFLPAIEESIVEAKQKIEQIKGASFNVTPTFENSVAALERASRRVDQVAQIFFHLHSAESNEEIRNCAKQISPLLSNFANDILLDGVLFERIKRVWEKRFDDGLKGEDLKLTEEYYLDFVRNGALLDESKKQQLRKIDEKLAKEALIFSDRVLKANNKFTLEISSRDDLKGMPESLLEAALEMGKSKGKEGLYVFTLDAPSYMPFMQYAENRALREKMYRAYAGRAFLDEETDNRATIVEIANLRHERANLLGYKTHADFVLEKRMAGSVSAVTNFLNDLLEKSRPCGDKEMAELNEFKKRIHPQVEGMYAWDFSFYTEKLKKEKFNIDDELLRPYFKLENVIDGVFEIAGKLFSLDFKEVKNIPLYHQEVKTFEVYDNSKAGAFIGLFYADFFPREGKRNGAWMLSLKDQYREGGVDVRPHVGIVCNFTKPTVSRPSLLTLSEVTTLFHEFGHALHGLLSDCRYRYFSGTNVYWDFVELPSQIMENWVLEKECLDLFAKHFESGETIPKEYVERILAADKFHQGYATLRQLSFGLLDLSWHAYDPKGIKVDSIVEHENRALEKTRVLPYVEGTNTSCAFSHIFSGGYSAGYYSYKWAEVLDADAFLYFKEKGIFNQEVAKKFKENILSRGGTEHPMELYKKFRGKAPTVDALLKRSGLL
ncbi:MAG: M3 family metallopeptidase [Oligoflexia bacterium]|nr:M3 family metallopeptidase [Oligoflexia bacterium]MBF0364255.1 M3 family metallopeptidase [Oligoflexia bacterium]